jgi:hypothetical protein
MCMHIIDINTNTYKNINAYVGKFKCMYFYSYMYVHLDIEMFKHTHAFIDMYRSICKYTYMHPHV